MEVSAHRGRFVESFAEYVQWRAGRKGVPNDRTFNEKMLGAFSEFLAGEGLGTDKLKHVELVAGMTAFAGQVPPGGPK